MATISLCMIVKNEEDTIERCLSSVKNAVDEIIIVDTGSTDKTKDIVYEYTDKVYDLQWVDDFSAARNYSFAQATMDYILWLDADDVILPDDNEKLLKLKESLTDKVDIVMMKYNTGFDEKGNVIFSCFRERLSKRGKGFIWKEPVHEYLMFWGNSISSDICVNHKKIHHVGSDRNIKIYEQRIKNNEELSARGKYYYARELRDHGRYEEAAKWFTIFLDTKEGWIEDNISACSELAHCYNQIDKSEKAFDALLRSFQLSEPRPEICCHIGYYFKDKEQYKTAIFWFELALNLKKDESNWGFCRHDYNGYVPALECVVCYDKIGEYKIAEAYNEKAAEYKSDSQAVIYNRKYFKERKEV